MKFIFENKKNLFLNNISNRCSLDIFLLLFYSTNLMCVFSFIII